MTFYGVIAGTLVVFGIGYAAGAMRRVSKIETADLADLAVGRTARQLVEIAWADTPPTDIEVHNAIVHLDRALTVSDRAHGLDIDRTPRLRR